MTVERNVYYDKTTASASHLEGEIDGIVETKTDAPAKPSETTNTLTSSPAVDPPAPATPPHISAPPPTPTPVPESTKEESPATKCIRKPSQRVVNLIEGRGTTSAHPSDPVLSCGVQPPSTITKEPNPVLEGEGQAEWMMWMNFVEELLMAAEISDAEALEPQTLAEAKSYPNWPLWEKAINEELETLRQAGTWKLTEPPSDANIVSLK